jgi:hypothetical protein
LRCTPQKSKERLKVDAHLRGTDLEVTNHDSFEWQNCILRANILSVQAPGYRYDSDIRSVAAGATVTVDAFKFHAGLNGGGAPLNPSALFNLGATCDTPAGQATGAVVRF